MLSTKETEVTQNLSYIPLARAQDSKPSWSQPSSVDGTNADIHRRLEGFPSRYHGDRVWVGSNMALKQDEWIMELSGEEQRQILEALRYFQSKISTVCMIQEKRRTNPIPGLKLPPNEITRQTFPLPQKLNARLRKISKDCYNGRGFCILRGLQPKDFDEEENVLVFAGLSAHVAPLRGFQDVKRENVICEYCQINKMANSAKPLS